MAVKFVDKEPEDSGATRTAAAPKPREPSEAATEPTRRPSDDLPSPKPTPKPRGRKKPSK